MLFARPAEPPLAWVAFLVSSALSVVTTNSTSSAGACARPLRRRRAATARTLPTWTLEAGTPAFVA